MLNESITSDPVPAFPANLRYIENGDGLNTTNHQLQAQDVAQAVGHLKGSITPPNDTYVQKGVLTNEDAGTVSARGFITLDTGPETGRQAVDLPNGVTVTEVTVYIDRNDTGSLPGTRASLFFIKQEKATGTQTPIVNAYEDPETDLADYNAYHAITKSALSEVIDNENFYYYVAVNNEQAPNDTYVVWYGTVITAT